MHKEAIGAWLGEAKMKDEGHLLPFDEYTSISLKTTACKVFDLREEASDKVLHRLSSNLEKLKSNGDNLAAEIQNRLRLIVAGGDSIASWLLGVVCDLKLAHSPPITTVPLGTGNNLSFSFGWGNKNPSTDPQTVKSFLEQVMKATEIKIDR